MRSRSLGWLSSISGIVPVVAVSALLVAAGCNGLSAFGGSSLQLNITDVQSRDLRIRLSGPDADARLLELTSSGETSLGQGMVSIERYVLQQVSFGQSRVRGLFLCAKPCSRPTEAFLVAFSQDQLFDAAGELRLQFRVEPSSGIAEELTHIISPGMLPDLWRQPLIEIPSEGRRP
jgi:hypothetical protein